MGIFYDDGIAGCHQQHRCHSSRYLVWFWTDKGGVERQWWGHAIFTWRLPDVECPRSTSRNSAITEFPSRNTCQVSHNIDAHEYHAPFSQPIVRQHLHTTGPVGAIRRRTGLVARAQIQSCLLLCNNTLPTIVLDSTCYWFLFPHSSREPFTVILPYGSCPCDTVQCITQ